MNYQNKGIAWFESWIIRNNKTSYLETFQGVIFTIQKTPEKNILCISF